MCLALVIVMMLLAMVVTMIIVVMVMLVFAMAATAAAATNMAMVVVIMVMVVMMVVMTMAMMVMAAIMALHCLLRIERAFDGLGSAALSADQFIQLRVALNVNCIGCDFSGHMLAAQLPGEPDQAKAVFRRYLGQFFRRSLHDQQLAILKPESITILENSFFFRFIFSNRSTLAIEFHLPLLAGFMIENNGIGNQIGLDGRLANNAFDAQHVFFLK
jgi:hypothetical protein